MHGLCQSSLERPQLLGVLPAFETASQMTRKISALSCGKVFLGYMQPAASTFVRKHYHRELPYS